MITSLHYLRGVYVTRLQFCITLVLFYNGSEEEGRENYKEFYALSKSINGIRLDRIDQGLGDQNLLSMVRKRSPMKNSTHLRFVSSLCPSAHTNATGAEQYLCARNEFLHQERLSVQAHI